MTPLLLLSLMMFHKVGKVIEHIIFRNRARGKDDKNACSNRDLQGDFQGGIAHRADANHLVRVRKSFQCDVRMMPVMTRSCSIVRYDTIRYDTCPKDMLH